MSEVRALKDLHTVETVRRHFESMYNYKVESVWSLGLQLALRISDLLDIKYTDIDQNNEIRIIESKTGKKSNTVLNAKAQGIVAELRKQNPDDIYLFQATGNRVKRIKPFSRQYITKAFKEVSNDLKLELGTHSMRKTRGYMMYKKTNDLAAVAKMLNHTGTASTLSYIGITREDVHQGFMDLEI